MNLFVKKFNGIISLITGNFIAQLVYILSIPIITRIYSPDQIGDLTILISVLTILNVFSTFKLELAIPIESNLTTLANLIFASLLILTGFTFLGLIGIHLLWSYDLFIPNLFFYLLPIMLFSDGLYNLATYYAIRSQNYRGIAVSKLSKSLLMNGSQITIGTLNSNSFSLIIGDILGRLFGANKLILDMISFLDKNINILSYKMMIKAITSYKKFPLISTVSAFLSSSSIQLFPIFIGVLYTNYYLGLYAMGQKILASPLSLISQSIGQFFFGNAAQLLRNGHIKELKKLFYKYVVTLFICSFIVVLIAAHFSNQIVRMFLGSEWVETVEVIKAISFMVIIQFSISPLSTIFDILQKQHIELFWNIFRFIIISFLLLFLTGGEISFNHALWIYSYIMAFTYIVLFIVIIFMLSKLD